MEGPTSEAETHRTAAHAGRVEILGVGFDRVDLPAAADWVVARHANGLRTFVITANPEFVMLSRREPDLAGIARGADLVVPDGTGILIASRVLGDPLPARVPGRFLVDAVLARLAPTGGSVFFLGAAPSVAERAAAKARERWPDLHVAGAHSGSPSRAEDAATRARINAASPRILLVAFGMPAQERWIARNLDHLGSVRIAIGVGGVLDQLAGRVRLPPRAVHSLGFEWLWRLVFEPRRWRRQRVLPVFAALVLRERLRRR